MPDTSCSAGVGAASRLISQSAANRAGGGRQELWSEQGEQGEQPPPCTAAHLDPLARLSQPWPLQAGWLAAGLGPLDSPARLTPMRHRLFTLVLAYTASSRPCLRLVHSTAMLITVCRQRMGQAGTQTACGWDGRQLVRQTGTCPRRPGGKRGQAGLAVELQVAGIGWRAGCDA